MPIGHRSPLHGPPPQATAADGAHAGAAFDCSLTTQANEAGHGAASRAAQAEAPAQGRSPHRADDDDGAQPSKATPQAAARAPAPAQTHSRHASARPATSSAPPRAAASQPPAALGDERPIRHASSTATPAPAPRRRKNPAAPDDGVPLQTLLAAAHPLLPSASDAATLAAAAGAMPTPHDVAASVTQAWVRDTPAPVPGLPGQSQWTFALGDPLTPLAALRVSGDAVSGWALQLTAGNGVPAHELAAQADRLRRRLQARGQAVERLDVDDDTAESPP